jgi:hypothetical protein
MNTTQLSPWLMLVSACACISVGCTIALRRPNQWKALLVLFSFALVCFGVLPAGQWFAALPWFKGSDSSLADHRAKLSVVQHND